jgi:hypothetical protein
MVRGIHLHEDSPDAFGLGSIEVVADERLVDDDTEFAAITEFRMESAGLRRIAFGDFLKGTVLEKTPDGAVHAARAGAELTLLRLETIEFGQDLDRHSDDVLIELEQGLGIVNQYVGVQDVSLFHVFN